MRGAQGTLLFFMASFYAILAHYQRMHWCNIKLNRWFGVRVPLGVVGVVYEARPNVTVDAAGLCLKSGNAVILRGGNDPTPELAEEVRQWQVLASSALSDVPTTTGHADATCLARRLHALLDEAGVSVEALRSYQSKGLLPPPRHEGRVAWYGDDHLEQLRALAG